MQPSVPTYPIIHVNVARDGSAHVNVAGDHRNYPPAPVEQTREQIIRYAVEVATRLGRAVRMTTIDPDGEWRLAVFPSGDVEPLEQKPARGRGRGAPTVKLSVDELAGATVLRPPPAALPAPTLPPRSATGTRVATVRFTIGDIAHITDRAIIGRQPEVAPEAVDESWQQVEVIDTSKTMSRVHAKVTWQEDVLWVRDSGSGNGTIVRRPDGGDIELGSDESFQLHTGDTLILGPVVSATVTIETRVAL